jgi:hypothetical protein
MNDTDQDFMEAFRKVAENSRLPKEEAWQRAFFAACLAFSHKNEDNFFKCIAAIYFAEGLDKKIGIADPTQETKH